MNHFFSLLTAVSFWLVQKNYFPNYIIRIAWNWKISFPLMRYNNFVNSHSVFRWVIILRKSCQKLNAFCYPKNRVLEFWTWVCHNSSNTLILDVRRPGLPSDVKIRSVTMFNGTEPQKSDLSDGEGWTFCKCSQCWSAISLP